MKSLFCVITLCCSLFGYGQTSDSITTEIFLDRELLEEFSIDAEFINSIEYTPDGFILLSSAKHFYLLGVGGLVPVFEKWNDENDIESFSITSDSILIVASGNALYQIDSDASFFKIIDIPSVNMGVTSKYDNIYVYDRTLKNEKEVYSIHQISRDGEVTILATVSNPVLSVIERPHQLIFSTKNELFIVDTETKKLSQILTLPQGNDIISIVGDTVIHAFYFSTANAIYRIEDNKVELITEVLGGVLKYDSEGLLIFSSEKQSIVRLLNNALYSITNNEKVQITTYAQGCNFNEIAQKHWDRATELREVAEKEEDYLLVANEYNNVLKYAPNCPDAHYNKAICYGVMSKFDSENSEIAIACYKKYLDLNPNADNRKDVEAKIHKIEINKEFSAEMYNIKGVNAYKDKDYQQAIECFNQAISIDPNSARTYCNLGNTYFETNSFEPLNYDRKIQALAYYKKAIDVDPNYAIAYRSLGNVNNNLGNNDIALAYYRRFVDFESNDAIECYNLGLHYSNKMHTKLALAYFDKAISIDPDFIDAYSMLGEAYAKLTQYIIKESKMVCVYHKYYEAIACYDMAASLASNFKGNEKFCISMYHKVAFIFWGDLNNNEGAKYYWKMAAKLGDKSAKQNLKGL